MWCYLLLLILFLTPSGAFALIDYQLDVHLNPKQQQLSATAIIDPDTKHDMPQEFVLAKNCTIRTIQQGGHDLDYTFTGDRLFLASPDHEALTISYACQFADRVDPTPAHHEDPGYGIAATISGDGSYLSAAAGWYPRFATVPTVYRINIEAPQGIEAITSGKRIEHQTENGRTRSSWLIDYPVSGLTLSSGRYQIFMNNTGRIPIYAYFYPSSAALADTYLEQARTTLELYEDLFGPYPFHKFAIVENFFPTGYGLPSWTLLGSSVIKLPFIVKTSLIHEIAHSWWGTGVRVDYSQGNWSEGLATYVADYLFKERESPEAAREYRRKILRDYASLVNDDNAFPVNRFTSRYDKASQAIGYGKVAMIFHMLREKVGDDIFWTGLRRIAEENMFSTLGWQGIARIFSEVSGKDLQPFFSQWLTRKKGPSLSFQDVRAHKDEAGWRVSGKLVQGPPIYRMNVRMILETDHDPLEVSAELESAEQEFEFYLQNRPVQLVADPDADQFRVLASSEVPSTVNEIRGSEKLLALRGEQNAPSPQAQETLLAALRKNDLQVHNKQEIAVEDLEQHDLLIFGSPPELFPRDFLESATTAQIHIDDKEVPLATHSAFLVTRNPLNPNYSAAWFISNDSAQAPVVARKIPHYGNYSHLLFEGATNKIKEIGAPDKSPLKIIF